MIKQKYDLRYKEHRAARLTVHVTDETAELFRALIAEQGTTPSKMLRSMVEHLIGEYADELR